MFPLYERSHLLVNTWPGRPQFHYIHIPRIGEYLNPYKRNYVYYIVVFALVLLHLLPHDRAHARVSVLPPALATPLALQPLSLDTPWVHLAEGEQLQSTYHGTPALIQSLYNHTAQPLTLGTGDFDRDGTNDLVAGYTSPAGNLLTFQRGNPDMLALHRSVSGLGKPRRAVASMPFLTPAQVFALPVSPEMIGIGDFDNDGWLDVVVTAGDQKALYLLPGNGHHGFAAVQTLALPGRVTALIAADVNRADGLVDLAIGVTDGDTSKLLVFESSHGAFAAAPISIDLPGSAATLIAGHLDDDSFLDLAALSGREVVIVHGQDRAHSRDTIWQAQVVPVRIHRYYAGFSPQDITAGQFLGDYHDDLALLSDKGTIVFWERHGDAWQIVPLDTTAGEQLLPTSARATLVRARLSGLPTDDLLVVDSASHQLSIVLDGQALAARFRFATAESSVPSKAWVQIDLKQAPVSLLPLRLNDDALSDLVILGSQQYAPLVRLTQPVKTFTVTSTADNDTPCTTQTCTLRAAINAANTNPGADRITFRIATGVQTIHPETALPLVTEPVTIDGTGQPGFVSAPLIVLNGELLSTDNGQSTTESIDGLTITGESSVIQALVVQSFPGNGVVIQSSDTIIRNMYLGTSSTGLEARGNQRNGLLIDNAANNTIGGTNETTRNVISGNVRHGVLISGASATGNQVLGNFIGINRAGTVTDADPSPALGNGEAGILIERAPDNRIGGTESGAGNVIAGNAAEGVIIIQPGATSNQVMGNLIGLDRDGVLSVSNGQSGVLIENAPSNQIGGTASGARNLISGNTTQGLILRGSSATGNMVQGNFIGVDRAGTANLGNTLDGVLIDGATSNMIGGSQNTAGNVISGNGGNGVLINGSNAIGNRVQGNTIGVNSEGSVEVGNANQGILINSAPGNLIGGADEGTGNLISGNHTHGIGISGPNALGNHVQGNLIGINRAGNAVLGNGADGINLSSVPGVLIGGTITTTRNIIAGNKRNGITVEGDESRDIQIQGNSIGAYSTETMHLGNASYGIALQDASNVLIGGEDVNLGNVIGGNATGGVLVSRATTIIKYNQLMRNTTGIQMRGNEALVVGNQIDSHDEVFDLTMGILQSYANNITNYRTALSTTGGTLSAEHNWWGRSTGPAPDGLDVETWQFRLYAEVTAWADGTGSATLGEAGLSGGTGTAVIVQHERTVFDRGTADDMELSQHLCSSIYDFFAIAGGGSWTVQIPVDNTPACASALTSNAVFWVSNLVTCGGDLTNLDCWEKLPPQGRDDIRVKADNQYFVVHSLRTSDLQRTLFAVLTLSETNLLLIALPIVGTLLLVAVALFFLLQRYSLWVPGRRVQSDETIEEG